MKSGKKIVWLLVSCLMALSLVMASCGPAEEEEEEEDEEVIIGEEEEEEEEEEEAKPDSNIPRYGGTLIVSIASDPVNFDSGSKPTGSGPFGSGVIYSQYMGADWLRGPAGSGVTNWAAGAATVEDFYMPQVAESWEIPEQGVWIMQIRQGMHWQPVDSDAGRLMGGREVTADDIVWSWDRGLASESAWINLSQKAVAESVSAEKTGDWEVTFRTPLDYLSAFFWLIQGGGYNNLWPKEVVEKYGSVADWKNAVGTGPFMIEDYVVASSLTFIKNPNHWRTDPIGPGKGNQLPYIDKWVQLVIPDWSTRLAGLRTGKIDSLTGLTKDNYASIRMTTPELKENKYLSNLPYLFAMRQDNPELPYSDIRVRHALMYATDFEAIKRDFYEGDAEILVYPVNKNFNEAYMSLEELPAEARDLYTYNPDKAKQLLAEAGYPDGFKVNCVVQNFPDRVDEVSIYKDMWSKVGIDLMLDTYEAGAYQGISARRNFDEMLYRFNWSAFPMIFYFSSTRGPSVNNPSRINDPPGADPVVEETFQTINSAVFIDNAKVYSTFKTMYPHMVTQSYVIPRPTPYTYNVWWPWLKNYYGVPDNNYFAQFFWIDQDLKESMGH